jgi:hypothetical protein
MRDGWHSEVQQECVKQRQSDRGDSLESCMKDEMKSLMDRISAQYFSGLPPAIACLSTDQEHPADSESVRPLE